MKKINYQAHQKQTLREQKWRTIAIKNKINPDIVPEFSNIFVQPRPKYAIEVEKKVKPVEPFNDEKAVHFWVTGRKKPVGYSHVAAHLSGIISLGSVSKWYTGFGLYDIDSRGIDFAEAKRLAMDMDWRNSILARSRTPDSFHIIFNPVYDGKPMTARLFQTIGEQISEIHQMEVYPQIDRCIRLPFGRFFGLAEDRGNISTPEELLEEFKGLQEYDLKEKWSILRTQEQTFFDDVKDYAGGDWCQQGKAWYANGLVERGTRYEAQARVIYYLFRRNTPPGTNLELTYKWIKKKHNGFSDAINGGRYQRIKNEIRKQVKWFYKNFEMIEYLPDSVHNEYKGYLTKPDLEEIVRVCRGNLSRLRFVSRLIQYANPRQSRSYIRIHSDTLKDWSSTENYLKYLRELEEKGIIKRSNAFSPGVYSKAISFPGWTFKESEKGIYVDERTPEKYDETVQAVFEPREYRGLLTAAGLPYNSAKEQTRRIYQKKV